MKKQSILSAAALTTLALAGAAQAGTLTAAPVAGATVAGARVIASEVKLDSKTNGTGVIGVALTPSTGAILPSGNALLTFSLTGGATFGSAVTAGAIVKNGTCAPTTTVSSGGAAAGSTVTFLISSLAGCNDTNAIHALIPAQLNSTAGVNVTSNLTTELGTAIDGGTASTVSSKGVDLISFAKAFSVKFTPDTVTTAATLVSKFKGLTADTALGTITVAADTTAYTGIAGTTQVAATDLSKAAVTLKGDFATVDVVLTGAGFSKAQTASNALGTATFTTDAPVVGTYAVNAAVNAKTPIIAGSGYTATVELTPTTVYNAIPASGPTALQPVTREGSSFLLPWVASGTLSKTSTSNTVVRIANLGTAASGAVSIELLTSSTGAPTSTALVPVASSIAAKGELVLTSALLEAYLGADFGRGDIRITVESLGSDLSVRRFVQSTVNGALSEVSLGRSALGTEPQN